MQSGDRKARLRDLAMAIQFVSSLLEVVAEDVANEKLHVTLQSLLAEADERARSVPWMKKKRRNNG